MPKWHHLIQFFLQGKQVELSLSRWPLPQKNINYLPLVLCSCEKNWARLVGKSTSARIFHGWTGQTVSNSTFPLPSPMRFGVCSPFFTFSLRYAASSPSNRYVNIVYYYTTQAVRGPITKINQSKCSIAGPIFSKYRTRHCPEWSRITCVPLNLKFKMADEDEIFRKFRRKTPEWMVDFEKRCFSLELEIFKSGTNDGAQVQQWKHRVRAR